MRVCTNRTSQFPFAQRETTGRDEDITSLPLWIEKNDDDPSCNAIDSPATRRDEPGRHADRPRQAGKTTLARAAFPNHQYLDLEDPEVREYARTDPQEFVLQIKDKVILDEPQKAPELLPYLQASFAAAERRGRFLLIASRNHMPLPASASTNLHLLPLAHGEVARTRPLYLNNLGWITPFRQQRGGQRPDLLDVLLVGGYPAVHRQCRGCPPPAAALAEDCGITHPTARRWLAVLESSCLITLVWPHRRHFHTRQAKSPKLFFLDTGLLCYLLRIRNANDLRTHPGRSTVFKSFVVSEFAKNFLNRRLTAGLAYWRGPRGHLVLTWSAL